VRVRNVERYEAAVLGFSGGRREKRYADAVAKLRAAISTEGLQPNGELTFARFDPPWKPGFLKYSEVIQPVAATESSPTQARSMKNLDGEKDLPRIVFV
jgi:hypothetical protein